LGDDPDAQPRDEPDRPTAALRLLLSGRLSRTFGVAACGASNLGDIWMGPKIQWVQSLVTNDKIDGVPQHRRGAQAAQAARRLSVVTHVHRKGERNMRFERFTSALLFVIVSLFLTACATSSAGRKEDVAAATMTWGQTLGQNDPDKLVLLYASDGVLWGTLSPTVRADRAALRDYFVTAFRVLPGLKVTFGEQLVRVYGDTAVNTGYYTFSYGKDGETKTLPARYSLTFVKEGEKWMIVDHHSSAMPPPPR